tara:strand:+ start:699 stop:1292 length:594 start_codon:yes stop_codon:yes gene_type:complete
MNILLIIAAILIVTETINPEVDEGKEIKKKEVIVETVETKPSEKIISEAQATAEAQAAAAAAEAEAKAAAEAKAKAAAEAKAKAAAEAKAVAEAEAKAAAEAQAAAEAEAKAAAQKEINYLKIALYIFLLLAILSGALLYFRKRDKSSLESKVVPPERKDEQPVQEDIQPEIKEEQPMDDANKEPTNFEETNEEEKK